MIGCGIDIVDLERFKDLCLGLGGSGFVDRCFLPEEVTCASTKQSRDKSLAGKFACKEAVLKALGLPLRDEGISHTDIQVLSPGNGPPTLVLRDRVEQLASQRGIVGWHLSISHSDNAAIAIAIASGGV